jgi:hypothetical protein
VTVSFDEDRRVTKLTFAGPAYAIQPGASSASIVTERQILFGLTSHTDEAEFRRILGKPVKETPERSTNQRVLHCVWKKSGYIVDAIFLGAESVREGATLPEGSLVQIDVCRGL